MENQKNKLMILGDIHLKDTLGYSDYIKNGRQEEKQSILDFIVEQANDCNQIILLGDNFNSKNNSSAVIREFTEFIEKFNNKEVYILAGNHEIRGNGETAIDYLKEIKNKRWHIATNKIEEINELVFCPYFSRNALDTKTNEEGADKLMRLLPKGNMLFVHHALTDTVGNSGVATSIFDEVVLPLKKLSKKYKLIFAGHVHRAQQKDNVIIAGSIFPYEVNEKEKFIYKLDITTMKVEKIQLPGRAIYGLTDPTLKDLEKLDKSSIVKVTITKKLEKKEMAELKDKLEEYDAHMLIENIPTERKKLHVKKGSMLDFSIENLLEMYSKERNIDLSKLKQAFDLIK